MTEVYIDSTVKALQQLHQTTLRTDKRTVRIVEFLGLQRSQLLKHTRQETAQFAFTCVVGANS